MDKSTNISQLDIGQRAEITQINLEGGILKRVYDLGFLPKVTLTCVMKAPGGSPIAYCIKGTVVALRKNDAQNILCSVASGGDVI